MNRPLTPARRNGLPRPLLWAFGLVLFGAIALLLAIGARAWVLPAFTAGAGFDAPPPGDAVALAQPTPSPMPTWTATPAPTATPVPTPLPTATPAPAFAPAQSAVRLTGLQHAWQTWNNCGPATLAMNLSYYGNGLDQAAIGGVLRLHEDDKNVSPQEMVDFAAAQGYHAELRVNGSPELLRLLLSNGIPVLVETWLLEEGDASMAGGLGHYRLLTGYDDAGQHWIAYDSYDATDLIAPEGPYQGIRIPYGEMDALWRVFNRTYLLITPPEKVGLVDAILGESRAVEAMWARSKAVAQAEVATAPDDAFGWFNLGTSLVALGEMEEATAAFDRARELGLPWRMLWYQFGPFQAYHQAGRHADLLGLANATLAGTASIEELHYWRGVALAALGRPAEARQAWDQALALNPQFGPALETRAAGP